jgi:BirA family biotin operon repressor/biotin-[acetyl-CoA-carboxylase] ligase
LEHNALIRQKPHRWLFYSRIDSTNREAQRQLRDGISLDGDVIWTDDQYEGQGQRGKEWDTEAGKNIAMSLVYLPHDLSVDRIFLVNEMVAVAVSRAIERETGLETKIKWPNDIYVWAQKVAGLLVQNGLKGKKVDHLIIGIGINVNQEDFATHLPNPGSLKALANKQIDRRSLMECIVEEVQSGLERIYKGEGHISHEQFQSRMLLLRRTARFKVDGEEVTGQINGIDENGRLILETENGLRFYNSGSIAYDKSSIIDHR